VRSRKEICQAAKEWPTLTGGASVVLEVLLDIRDLLGVLPKIRDSLVALGTLQRDNIHAVQQLSAERHRKQERCTLGCGMWVPMSKEDVDYHIGWHARRTDVGQDLPETLVQDYGSAILRERERLYTLLGEEEPE
jgi:hypothetical protein